MKYHFKICSEVTPLENHYSVSVDGNVIGSDLVFDHHRKGGADVQMDELPEMFDSNRLLQFVSPSLDEDCVISTAILISGGMSVLDDSAKKILRTSSMSCDQLTEGNKLFFQLKDYDYQLLNEHKNDLNDKSIRYELLVISVLAFIENGTFPESIKPNYQGYFKRYLSKQEITVLQTDIIREMSDHCTYVNIKDNSFISPLVIYQDLRKKGKHIALIEYRSNHQGRVYTIGYDPISELDKESIFELFDSLNEIDEYCDVQNAWGGRSGVGGSPQIKGSFLSPQVIIKTIERVLYGK